MPKKKKRSRKNRLSPWGKLRIQAGTAERHGDLAKAKKFRAEADRLEAKGGGKPAPKATAGGKKDMARAMKYVEQFSKDLGLTPGQVVEVFRSGIRQTLSRGLGG